jgi:FkbM family methyltransferase
MFFVRSKDLVLPQSLRINGRRVAVSFPPDDWAMRGIFAEVLLEDVYGLHRHAGRLRTVLDVGANVGMFCLAARISNPDATIHAYEPNAQLEPYLAAQCAAADATYFIEALATDYGQRSLIETMSSSGYSQTAPGDDIPAVPLALAVERLGGWVDFAKIDCEGAEWELFADEEPWRSIGAVSMEFHLTEGMPRDEAVRALTSLGFTIDKFHAMSNDTGIVLASREEQNA